MSRYKKKPTVVEAITFDELVYQGRHQSGANIVNGMPWSFTYKGQPVTHENDECYKVACYPAGSSDMTPDDMLVHTADGLRVVSIKMFDERYEKLEDK